VEGYGKMRGMGGIKVRGIEKRKRRKGKESERKGK
jgi:hypothetical protein